MAFFDRLIRGFRDHWNKVSIPNKDKPEGTITFDHEGNVVEIQNVKIIKRPEAKPEIKPEVKAEVPEVKITDPVASPVVIPPKPVEVPPAPVIDAVAVTPPKANTVVEAPKQIDTANNTISGLVKGIMEQFKK